MKKLLALFILVSILGLSSCTTSPKEESTSGSGYSTPEQEGISVGQERRPKAVKTLAGLDIEGRDLPRGSAAGGYPKQALVLHEEDDRVVGPPHGFAPG